MPSLTDDEVRLKSDFRLQDISGVYSRLKSVQVTQYAVFLSAKQQVILHFLSHLASVNVL